MGGRDSAESPKIQPGPEIQPDHSDSAGSRDSANHPRFSRVTQVGSRFSRARDSTGSPKIQPHHSRWLRLNRVSQDSAGSPVPRFSRARDSGSPKIQPGLAGHPSFIRVQDSTGSLSDFVFTVHGAKIQPDHPRFSRARDTGYPKIQPGRDPAGASKLQPDPPEWRKPVSNGT